MPREKQDSFKPPALDTRQHILLKARRAFAAKGFAGTSTREICKAAKIQVRVIAYHCGEKAGLYREIIVEPLAAMMNVLPMPTASESLDQTLLKRLASASGVAQTSTASRAPLTHSDVCRSIFLWVNLWVRLNQFAAARINTDSSADALSAKTSF